MSSAHLLVFARAPVEGQVKTRLAARLGRTRACEIYTRLLQQTLLQAARFDRHYELYLSGELDHPWLISNAAAQQRHPQQGEDLGQRMAHAFTQSLKQHSQVILIGSDCPAIDQNYLQQAATALQKHDWVIGPATDGGYVLIGCSRFDPRLFEQMPWSQPDLLQQTLAKIGSLGMSVALLKRLSDVDTVDDLAQYPEL